MGSYNLEWIEGLGRFGDHSMPKKGNSNFTFHYKKLSINKLKLSFAFYKN
jgi:hypothetical protein